MGCCCRGPKQLIYPKSGLPIIKGGIGYSSCTICRPIGSDISLRYGAYKVTIPSVSIGNTFDNMAGTHILLSGGQSLAPCAYSANVPGGYYGLHLEMNFSGNSCSLAWKLSFISYAVWIAPVIQGNCLTSFSLNLTSQADPKDDLPGTLTVTGV